MKNIIFFVAGAIFYVVIGVSQPCGSCVLATEERTLPLAERLRKDGWVLSGLDTARSATYLNTLEKDVVLATNAVRVNPRKFAELYVKTTFGYYAGKIAQYPNGERYKTNEGLSAVKELYEALRKQASLPALRVSRGMSRAAADHAKDQSVTGATGHVGGDGSQSWDRVNRYGAWQSSVGENISYGYNDGLRIVVQLLVDDGVPSRGHRKNIFAPNYGIMGVSIDRHPKYRYSCVITYAGGYTEQ